FSPLTLMARIKAVTRRVLTDKQINPSKSLLMIDEQAREVYAAGEKVKHLTPKEFELLTFLIQHENQVFDREQLLEKVWGFDFYGDDRTVDVHMKRLRTKIGKPANRTLQTVWGVGYKYEASPAEDDLNEV